MKVSLVWQLPLLFQGALSFAPPVQKTSQLLLRRPDSFLVLQSTSTPEKTEETLADGSSIQASFLSTSPKTLLGKSIPYAELVIGVMKESADGEARVSLTPSSVETLVKEGFQVLVQTGGTCVRYLQDSKVSPS
jgi:Alanine dehydrogenase/PNT, N-terminal domain